MNVNRGKMIAAAVLAVTLLVVGGVTGYGLHRAGTVGQPFVEVLQLQQLRQLLKQMMRKLPCRFQRFSYLILLQFSYSRF